MNRTFCDFYAFRSQGDPQGVIDALRLGMGGNGYLLGHELQPTGWHGYSQHSLLNYGGIPVGLVAWGGANQLGWVYASLSGKGCDFVESWEYFEAVVKALPEFGYRRVDLALDIKDGTCTHDRTVEAYRNGMFDDRGKRPKAERIEPEDRSAGCTFYVGKRKGWKYVRAYDKGCEIRAKSGPSSLTHIGGIKVEDLYRIEVEFKAVDGGTLPLDLVENRDTYFAGAYPYLATLLDGIEGAPFRLARRHTMHADLDRCLATCRRMFGAALAAAEKVHGGNRDAVWQRIVGDRITDRWIAAGANFRADEL